jgi:serine protease AprX
VAFKGLSWGKRTLCAALTGLALMPVIPAGPASAGEIEFLRRSWEDENSRDSGKGEMPLVTSTIGAPYYWARGYDGEGIDVVIIDTGVSPVIGLDGEGKIVNGPDLSFDGQAENLRYLDGDGHGTHLAGIIAGSTLQPDEDGETFSGVAPGARIVNVRVGDHEGAVDVSQVLAAIDWVIEHRQDNGLNIRVLNLSFGTDSSQDPSLDPLSFAVERAWKAGIVVVVAAGNDGNARPLRMPAANPFVIAVGATDTVGSRKSADDVVADYSNCGVGRTVDLVAPGESIQSLRVEKSKADLDYPGARSGRYKFRGSGTSQAAAVVSGAVALILDQRPGLSPDKVKALLTATARSLRGVDRVCQGAGTLDLRAAYRTGTPPGAGQNHLPALGIGSLETSRGTDHLEHEGVVLAGEQDIFGRPWDGLAWTTAATTGATWSGGTWIGSEWSGASWSGLSWSGTSWSGVSWSGVSWSGISWSGQTWTGTSWSGASWSDRAWTGASWSGASWTGAGWGSMGRPRTRGAGGARSAAIL